MMSILLFARSFRRSDPQLTSGLSRRPRIVVTAAACICLLLIGAGGSTSAQGADGGQAVVKVAIGNLRSRPSTQAPVVDKLRRGEQATILEKEGAWYRVGLSGDREGWVHEIVLAPAPHATESMSSTGEDLSGSTATFRVPIGRVRSMPSTDGEIEFRLLEGARVSITKQQGEWLHISVRDGRTGWVHRSLLTLQTTAPPAVQEDSKTIMQIRVEAVADTEEKVVFDLSGFFTPKLFVVTGEKPKVICDFSDVILDPGIEPVVLFGGNLISQITIEEDGPSESNTRIVLDLVPEKNYAVQPVFYRSENRYQLTVTPKDETLP